MRRGMGLEHLAGSNERNRSGGESTECWVRELINSLSDVFVFGQTATNCSVALNKISFEMR